jgi:outer membrane lipoprotein-sorting protein
VIRTLLALVVLLPAPQGRPADAAAEAALKKLAARMRDARTLTANVVQSRKTELLDKPIVSSGSMAYRREPAQLMFRLTEPRHAEILLDKASYQVYRPDERRLERIDFEGEDVTSRILLVFEPKSEEVGKAFRVTGRDPRDGRIDVVLEASDERVRKRMKQIVLTVAEADGTLSRIAYIDAEGDEVQFELSQVVVNPDLPPDAFSLKVPEGTRILRRTVKPEK